MTVGGYKRLREITAYGGARGRDKTRTASKIFHDWQTEADKHRREMVKIREYWASQAYDIIRRYTPMKHLLFDRPKFHKGLNYTVRQGHTWMEIVQPGDIVRIGIPNGSNGGGVRYEPVLIEDTVGKVIHQIFCRIQDIPRFVFENEHDPKCRDMGGLLAELERHYGELKPDTQVTCLGFMVLKEY